MIVIEGMDNSGKSTLGALLAERMGFAIQESEGPPRATDNLTAAEEINHRIERYAELRRTIFVRHPVSSNAIYGAVREEGDPVLPELRDAFYSSRPIIVYCDAGDRGLEAHIAKAHDTEKHLRDITQHYESLLYLYRCWAAQKADFIYRIGDDMELICYLIEQRYNWLFHR